MRPAFVIASVAFLAANMLASRAAAQQPPESPAERAAVARQAFQRAGASQHAGLHDSVWADLNRAHDAWPAQVAYGEAVARFAARRGEAAALERVLRRLAAQGVGLATSRDTTIARVAPRTPSGTAALAALRAAIATSGQSRPRVLLSDTSFFAEGLDVDPASGTLYVTSLHHRTVMAVSTDGTGRSALVAAPSEVAGVFGVAFDGTRGVLWMTTAGTPHMRGYQPSDSARAELLQVRLADGRIVARWTLGDGSGAPGELAVAANGDVLVSDALKGRLYRLRGGEGTLAVVTSPLLRSPQGIAPSADSRTAWIADWSHGLLRWDLTTDSITAVATSDDLVLLGIDGLRRAGDRLVAVQNGVTPARVLMITLERDGRAVRAVSTLDRPVMEGEPTVGALAGDRFVYVSSSAWPFWSEAGARLPGTPPLPPVTVRELRLPQ